MTSEKELLQEDEKPPRQKIRRKNTEERPGRKVERNTSTSSWTKSSTATRRTPKNRNVEKVLVSSKTGKESLPPSKKRVEENKRP